MLQRDYILRMIEEMGLFLQRLMGYKTAQQVEQALVLIDTAGRTLIGLDMRAIRILSAGEIIHLVGPPGKLNAGKYFVIASLLKEDARFRDLAGETGLATKHRLKAMVLFLEAYQIIPELFSKENQSDLFNLHQQLSARELPPDSRLRLAHFMEKNGHFDIAENLLFYLREDGDPEADKILGDFYHRLLSLPDEALTAGNLPRSEILEDLARLDRGV